jgi:N utilization substance protein A
MSNLNPIVRTEFAAALAQIATERKIPVEAILEAIKQALVSAFRKQFGPLDEGMYYYATVNGDTGESKIYKCPALEIDEETGLATKWDESKSQDVTPAGFGRIAAQTAKQVILQKIRESEKEQIISDYADKVGEIVTAQVLRMDGRTVILDIGRGQGYMPPEEQMRGEFYRMNARVTVLIKEIRETFRGQTIIVSRADKNLVSKLFEREVPEVASGAVKVVAIAREAGVRTKLAVKSTQEGVDPVGSCVGQRGVRVQEVIKELNNEKIDIIPYAEDQILFLKGALAPAESLKIVINDKKDKAVVTAPDDQLSLAIGRGGQNVRLAAKLTGYKITVQSAGGQVKSEVTGEEEYEIDIMEGITAETRAFLVEHKLTTVGDLARFRNKWLETEKLEADQRELLLKAVEKFEQEMAEADAAYAAAGKEKTDKPEEAVAVAE